MEHFEQFIQRVKRNSELTELTPYALRELVRAVYVEAPDKSRYGLSPREYRKKPIA